MGDAILARRVRNFRAWGTQPLVQREKYRVLPQGSTGFLNKKGGYPQSYYEQNGNTPKNVSPSSLVEVFLKRFQHSGSEPNNQAKILDVSSLLLSKLTVQLAPKNNNGMVNKITTFLEIRFKLTFFCCFHTDPLLHTALFSCVLLHQ